MRTEIPPKPALSPDDPPGPERQSALAPLRHPVFRSVWIASLGSNFGGLIQAVGASWMMTSIADSADKVALVQASTTLPIMLLSLAAGALADNMDRRRLMLAAQTFMLAVSITLAVFTWAGLVTPWLLLLFTFLIGCGTAFNGPAWQASVGEMVPRRDLAGAIMLNSMGFNMARSVGPAVGGLIVAAAGAAAAFAVNAVSYIGLVVVLARWKPDYPPRLLPRETLGVAMSAGIRYVAMSPSIGAVLLRGLVFGAAASAIPALMPLVAQELIGGGPLVYGLLFGAFGVGAVTGAFSRGFLRAALSPEMIVRLSCFTFGLAALAVGLSPVLWLTMPALMVTGAGWVLALSSFNVTVQMSAPRWVVARALSIYQMATFGGMAAGSWGWGLIAEGHGVAVALYVSALVQLACALIGLRVPLPASEHLNLDPLRPWKEPETAVPILGRSGPVVVTIDYVIHKEDVLDFLAVMSERRRIRRRDGARHWTLARDLADPEKWVERYQTPTWLDYVRHNQRITQADAEITERIRALHKGVEPPQVHRMIERQTGSIPAGRAPHPHPREMHEPLTDPTRSS